MPRFKELKDVWGQFEVLRRCGSAIGDKHVGLLRATSDSGVGRRTPQRESSLGVRFRCARCKKSDQHE